MATTTYGKAAEELRRRVQALADKNPDVYKLTAPFDLFKLGLKCADLHPTLGMTVQALNRVIADKAKRPG